MLIRNKFNGFSATGRRVFQFSDGGGGGTSTTQTSNIPEYARPYVENMLGATQKQLFNTTTDPETGKISLDSFKEYKPYSQNVQEIGRAHV